MANYARYIADVLIQCHRLEGWRAEREALFCRRRIDVLAISPGGTKVIAFEIKTNINDFRLELRNPDKRGTVMRNSTHFYFVVPCGMVMSEDVPVDCGLIYIDGNRLLPIKFAPGDNDNSPAHSQWLSEQWSTALETEGDDASTLQAFDLPPWMLPVYPRPLRFKFDVLLVAKTVASAVIETLDIDFDAVPF